MSAVSVHEEISGEEGKGGKGKNWIWTTIKYILALALVYLVVSQTDISQLAALRERISFGWLGVYFLIFVLLTLIKTFQYWRMLGGRVPFLNMLRVVVWQNSISNFIATGAGVASYLAMLRAEQGVKLRNSGIVFIVTKVGEVLMVGVYLALSAWICWPQIQDIRALVIVILVGILAGFGAFMIAILWREAFFNVIKRMIVWLRLDRIAFVNQALDSLHALVTADQRDVFRLLKIGFGISFVYVSISNLLFVTSLRVFSVDVGIWPVIFVGAFIQLFANIPIQVLGGLGVSEVTSVYVYAMFGVDTAVMAAVQIGIRAVIYLCNAALLLYLPVDRLFLHKRIGSDVRKGEN